MTDPSAHAHFSQIAAEYAAYRPHYPAALFDFLAERAPARTLAWDCGCGNGQATIDLAERFDRVIGTDPSASQIAQAPPHPRIEWRIAPGERSGIPNATCDLVTVAQALHETAPARIAVLTVDDLVADAQGAELFQHLLLTIERLVFDLLPGRILRLALGRALLAAALGLELLDLLHELVALAKAKPGTINFGSAGLATDTIQWALWKRQLQRAADSAAFAGAYARFQDKSSSDAVTRDLTNNNHLWVPLMSGYPQVSEPADTATFVRAVQVSLQVQQPLTFSSMFLSSAPIITATARAAAIDSKDYCVVALESTNNAGIIIQGSSVVNMGCGMISNSPAPISVGVNGTAHNVTAVPVAGAGGVPDINGVSSRNLCRRWPSRPQRRARA